MTASPQQWTDIILGIIGILVSLTARFVPKIKAWYESLPHQGVAMLIICAVIGLIYFGLSCTSLAEVLAIETSCTPGDLFALFKALLILGAGNQLAYAFVPKSEELTAIRVSRGLRMAQKMKLVSQ